MENLLFLTCAFVMFPLCFYRPYVIDLESTNGTYVNNQRIESARYYELKEKVRGERERERERVAINLYNI